MKTTRTLISRTAAVLATFAIILLAGCSFPNEGEGTLPKAEGKGSLSITVPMVSPQLSFLANSSASSSKGYMFLSQLNITIYDSVLSPIYTGALGTGATGQNIQGVIHLPVGTGYTIDLVGYNNQESVADPVVQGSTSESFAIEEGKETKVRIGLTPVSSSPLALTGLPGAQTLSSNTGVIADNVWTRYAGEKWFSIVPTQNTVSITATPTGSHIHFSLYDATGSYRGGGTSPGYVGDGTGTYGTVATLDAGVTPEATYYVGAFTVLEGTDTVPSSASFTINATEGGFSDDAYEVVGFYDNDTGDHAAALGTSPVEGLFAWDEDWYLVNMEENTDFDFLIDFGATLVSGNVEVYDSLGQKFASAWTDNNNTVSSFTLTGTSANAGDYFVHIRAFARSTTGSPIPGAGYSISYSLQAPVLFANAEALIPDSALRAAIETAIGKSFGDTLESILLSDMDGLKNLKYDGYSFDGTRPKISSLVGIGNCPNLENVYFTSNAITDLSPLTSLSKLVEIQVKNNLITNLSPLAGMGSLRRLYVAGNQISSIGSISGMNWLTAIAVHNNPLPISQLQLLDETYFPNLSSLAMDGGDEITMQPLGMTSDQLVAILAGHAGKLTTLKLYGFGLGNDGFIPLLNSLTNKAAFTSLDLSGWGLNKPADESLLGAFTGLKELTLDGNYFISSSFLSGMSKLQYFRWCKGAPPDIMDNLTVLKAGGTAFTDEWAFIDVTNNKLDMLPGSPNMVKVTALKMAGIDMSFHKGNFVHALTITAPSAGLTFGVNNEFTVSCEVAVGDQNPTSMSIQYFVDNIPYTNIGFGISGSAVPDLSMTINTTGTHVIKAQIVNDSIGGGMSAPVNVSVDIAAEVYVGIN